MPATLMTYLLPLLLLPAMLLSAPASADVSSAQAAMEDPANPLLLVRTSRGDLFMELLPQEAPANVANFLALAQGEVEITNAAGDTSYRPRYFDGSRFHRVIPGFVIQAGSPAYHPLGTPAAVFDDEINAVALGLDREFVLGADGSINSILGINSKQDFADRVLTPLYADLNIDDADELEQRQFEVLEALQEMSLRDLYEAQGYEFQTRRASRPVTRGVVALANRGPNSNGPEFFIALTDSSWLSGKYTVIGHVVEGMTVADEIGSTAIDRQSFSRLSPVIYSVMRIN
jgi:cyclophilin family peptidyl-prolyl cis-trans isomerase